MHHSLEVRVPLLDREVIDVATRINWSTCLDFKQEIGKLPLRRSLARHVKTQSQSKRGFTVPMDDWMRGPLGRILQEKVLGRTEFLGLPFNSGPALKMFNEHKRGECDFGYGLWVLLSLALWEEKHLGRAAS